MPDHVHIKIGRNEHKKGLSSDMDLITTLTNA